MQYRFKFRAWDKQNKAMHCNDFIVSATGYMAKLTTQDYKTMQFDQYDLKPDDNYVLMQCTGLMDKNKMPIFEGDILKETYVSEGSTYTDITVVKYDEKSAGFIMARPAFEKDITYFDDINLEKENFVVIGNIYENPELLEASDGTHN